MCVHCCCNAYTYNGARTYVHVQNILYIFEGSENVWPSLASSHIQRVGIHSVATDVLINDGSYAGTMLADMLATGCHNRGVDNAKTLYGYHYLRSESENPEDNHCTGALSLSTHTHRSTRRTLCRCHSFYRR